MGESSSANPEATPDIPANPQGSPIVTVIRVVDAGGDDCDRVVARLAASMQEIVGGDWRAISSQALESARGARVVHCVQLRSRGALEAILGVNGAKARRATIAQIAEQETSLYEWATFGASGVRSARSKWFRFGRRFRKEGRLRPVGRLGEKRSGS